MHIYDSPKGSPQVIGVSDMFVVLVKASLSYAAGDKVVILVKQ